MEKSNRLKLSAFLKVDFSNENDIWLTNAYTLRKLIGILGMCLPVLLYVFLYIDSGLNHPLESISHYYFTRVSSILCIIISLMAVFLIVYKGKSLADYYISSVAGIFAFLVILFPTSNISDICYDVSKRYSVTILSHNDLREKFHYISAAIFLICLAYMSLFLFTKSNKSPKERGLKKIIRNRIYRVGGVIMIIAILIIFLGFLGIIPIIFYDQNHLTYWMETLAVESFGIAWLIKGETLFKDQNKTQNELP
jgi:hypothetical protein